MRIFLLFSFFLCSCSSFANNDFGNNGLVYGKYTVSDGGSLFFLCKGSKGLFEIKIHTNYDPFSKKKFEAGTQKISFIKDKKEILVSRESNLQKNILSFLRSSSISKKMDGSYYPIKKNDIQKLIKIIQERYEFKGLKVKDVDGKSILLW